MEPINFEDYKRLRKAKLIEADLANVLKIINLTAAGLGHYSHYSTVPQILQSLYESRAYLNIHLERVKKIIDNNGRKG